MKPWVAAAYLSGMYLCAENALVGWHPHLVLSPLELIEKLAALVCPACGGPLQIIAALTDPHSIRGYLEAVGLPSRAPRSLIEATPYRAVLATQSTPPPGIDRPCLIDYRIRPFVRPIRTSS